MWTFCEVAATPKKESAYTDATVCVHKTKGTDTLDLMLLLSDHNAELYHNFTVTLGKESLGHLIAALQNAKDNNFDKAL